MRINNLINYVDNSHDKLIFNALNKSTDEDIFNYVINLTSDLIQVAFVTQEFKLNALNNLSCFNDDEIGEIATYATLTPYFQLSLQKQHNWEDKANLYLEMFIAYIIKTIDKNEFLDNLLEMKNNLNISNKFYEGLIIYFGSEYNLIKSSIEKNIKERP